MNEGIFRFSVLKRIVRLTGQRLEIRFVDVLLAFFLWFSLLLLSGIGSVSRMKLADLGQFVGFGSLVLALGILVVGVLAWRKRSFSFVPFLVFSALILLPACSLSIRFAHRNLLIDLYFILLLATPAFLSLWSWRFQVLAGFFALAVVSWMWIPVGVFVTVHSVMLILLTSVFSSLVVLLRARETVQETQDLEWKGLELFYSSIKQRFPQYVWRTIFLLAGLLVVLIFLDAAFRGIVAGFQPFLLKVYGLILLVFASLLVRVVRPVSLVRIVEATVLFIGALLSLTRMGYAPTQHFAMSLPLVYVAFVMVLFPASLTAQIAVIWAIVFMDCIVKLFYRFDGGGSLQFQIGYALQDFRGELGLLLLGAAAAVLVARWLRYYRVRNFSHFDGLLDSSDISGISPEGLVSLKEAVLPSYSEKVVAPHQRQRVIIGLFILGLISCLMTSRILVSLSYSYWELAIASWIVFFLICASLVYLDRRRGDSEAFWVISAITELLLVLCPSILLTISSEPGIWWLFWPFSVLVGIGVVPWRVRELVPIALASSFVGVELLYRLELGVLGAVVFSVCFILGILFSLQGTQRIKERTLLTYLARELDSCHGEVEVLRVLADYLSSLFGISSILCSCAPNHLELVRGRTAFLLEPGQWPLRSIKRKLPDVEETAEGVSIRVANWLPTSLSFFDRRFGLFSTTGGLLLEISLPALHVEVSPQESEVQQVEKEGDISDDRSFYLLLAYRLPFFEIFNGAELRAMKAMCSIARSRLLRFLEEEMRRRVEYVCRIQIQEREYDLSTLVHDINNTVQDLTLLCDTILEDVLHVGSASPEDFGPEVQESLAVQIKRIAVIARSVATVVSDAKRKRELEKLSDLRPRELVDVPKVIREIISFAVIRAERKRIFVEQPKLPEEPVWVKISVREHLETILRNLLDNAITYSSPGSTVRLELRYDKEWVWIDVIDNGPGLSKEERQSIFVSGFRGRLADGVRGGLGLGLVESRRVAEAAGGKLEAFSAGIGQGSTFTVTLPRHATPVKRDSSHPWALLVDDQPALVEFYSRLAKALNMVPFVASSASEAEEIIGENGEPALVITDIHLGGRSGLDLVKELREEFGGGLPILVVSGLNEPALAEKAMASGATDFVAKPVSRRALFARIQSILP